MAKCEKQPITEPKYEYVLTLTEWEAQLVAEAASSIRGTGEPFDDAQNILRALLSAGAEPRGFVLDGVLQVKEGPNA